MRLPCKFDNVTASNSENNYTFINKVSCLSCITSQSEPNWAKTFLSDAHQAEVIFFVSFLDCGFSQMSGQIVSIIVKNLLERQIWYRQGALKWKRPHFRFTSVAQKRLWLSSPIMPLYTHDSLLVSLRWYHGLLPFAEKKMKNLRKSIQNVIKTIFKPLLSETTRKLYAVYKYC